MTHDFHSSRISAFASGDVIGLFLDLTGECLAVQHAEDALSLSASLNTAVADTDPARAYTNALFVALGAAIEHHDGEAAWTILQLIGRHLGPDVMHRVINRLLEAGASRLVGLGDAGGA